VKTRDLVLLVTLGVAALVPACGSHGFGGPGGDDGSSDGLTFGADGNPGDGSTPKNGCDPTCVGVGGTCSGGVCTIVDNGAGLSSATQSQLEAGGTADSQFAWLYPYDQTVWPRGLLPATLQLAGTSATDAYVHITASTLDYKGFFAPPAGPLRVALSQPMWNAVLSAISSSKDPVKVDVTKLFNGNITGPATETWFVAQGNLRGTIYYETYDSQVMGGLGSVGIMKIQPGATTPTIVKQGCGNVCHTASADGSTLVANTLAGFASASYDLKSNAAPIFNAGGEIFTYGGIYPDGSFVMSATNYRLWLPGAVSRLYDTKTGANIPASGWDGTLSNGGTTAFAPDGKKIAFVHEDKDGGHTLSVMDFDVTKKAFSNLVDVATHAGSYVAWPAFTPDSQYVVYHAGSNAAFETDNDETGDVYAVELATHTIHRLDALDGYAGSKTYLPANDPELSFAPTVLPEAVGGFFWVVFTSHRSYGNTLPSKDNGDEYGKLWVAALDIGAAAGTDGSHPAFFLDGQEHTSDNLRGFWVLDPCKADGQTCGSGDQCCGGYCRSDDGGPLVCVPPPGGCAHEYEKCTTSSDCCDTGDQCINGKCAVVVN
jgi:hypothetical protein